MQHVYFSNLEWYVTVIYTGCNANLSVSVANICSDLYPLTTKINDFSALRPEHSLKNMNISNERDDITVHWCWHWSCFCCRTASDLTPLTSPTCCTRGIIAKCCKADAPWFPGDHREEMVLFFLHWSDKNTSAWCHHHHPDYFSL